MNNFFLVPVLLVSASGLAQNQADEYFGEAAMQQARNDMYRHHGDTLQSLFIMERLEAQEYDSKTAGVWEAQGWVGKDSQKLWLKSEGHYDGEENTTEEWEFQALYSHAVSPFWDFQAGWRHLDYGADSKQYLALGFMGLAPYWFEMDNALFISGDGDVSARLEAEYELLLTQRLILQPRAELELGLQDELDIQAGSGVRDLALEFRLRYEIIREFAPYLGISWHKAYSKTADLLEQAGASNEEFSVVAGFRFWY